MINKDILEIYHNNFENYNFNNNLINFKTKKRFDLYLLKENFISKEQLVYIWSTLFDLRTENITYFDFNKKTIDKVSIDWLLKYEVIPFNETSKVVKVLIDDPLNYEIINLVERLYNKKAELFYKEKEEIVYLINLLSMNIDIKHQNKKNLKIEKLIDSFIQLAISCKASDMHFEINDESVNLLYRIDGMLKNLMVIDLFTYKQLLTKIKILSNLDVTLTQLPQDGHFVYTKGSLKMDIRTSTIPTISLERLALRFLNENENILKLEQLGLDNYELTTLTKQLNESGIILVTGPTGSGKTTTLYAILDYLKKQNKNIMTIEDPIERKIENITQIPLNMMSYPQILKSVVRQDPDVIMLGEIRDSETASLVVKLAQTGVLILATIHSSTAVGVITRLINLAIPKYLIVDTLKLVFSQKLVRKKCDKCENGCSKCFYTGYSGRILLSEMLKIDDYIKESLMNDNYQLMINEYQKDKDLKSIAKKYYLEGKITYEELVRTGLVD